MPQINLASDVFRARLIARRRRVFYVLSAFILLLALFFWGLPLFLQSRVKARIADVDREIRGFEAQLAARQEEVRAIKLFAERLSLLKDRLASRIGWSRILGEFERTTTPPAAFQKLTGSADTGVIIADVLVPNLDAAADLLASLQQVKESNETFFSSVEVTDISTERSDPTSVGYTVSLQLNMSPSHFALTASP